VTVANDKFPPAKRMLKITNVYKAEDIIPPMDYIEKMRKK